MLWFNLSLGTNYHCYSNHYTIDDSVYMSRARVSLWCIQSDQWSLSWDFSRCNINLENFQNILQLKSFALFNYFVIYGMKYFFSDPVYVDTAIKTVLLSHNWNVVICGLQKIFEDIIETLIKLLSVSTEAKIILGDVMLNTGFFDDNSRSEVYAWVCAFDSIKQYANITEVITIFVNACSYVRSNIKDLCHLLNSIKESINQSSDSLSSGVLDWSALISCK